MAEVRKIQCPSCGSNSTYKLFDGSYKCNYCQGTFIVNEGHRQTQRPVPLNNAGNQASGAITKKVVLIIAAAFIILAMTMVGFLMTKQSTSYGVSGSDAEVPAKQAVIVNTTAFAGAKANVIWIVLEKPYSTDSLYYELLVVDPKSNVLMGKQLIGAPFSTNKGFDLSRVFGNRFLKFGDLAYAIVNDTALSAYDIYSGKQVLTNQSISEKIPGAASSILKVEYMASDKVFKVITTSGDILSFNPFSRAFVAASEAKSRKEEEVTKEVYLSDGLKHHLYLFTKRGNGFPIIFGDFIQESRLPGADAPKTNNVKDIFGNIHVEKLSEKNYFRAQPLLRDTMGNLLILYKTSLTEESPVILESVNKEGKANWSLQDTSLLSVGKAFAGEDLGCDYTFSDRVITICLGRGEKRYIAIEINTGKILWRFDPNAYVRQQFSNDQAL